MSTTTTYRCCGHCLHGKPVAKYARILDGHSDPCQRQGCKGSEVPSVWMRLASWLNLFTVR
jgi:hypothetical protein